VFEPQNIERNECSKGDTWHVPPLPGPSQGYLQPKSDLSEIKREDLEKRTPLKAIKSETCMLNA
jgi:hypothetical protein